MSYIGSKPANKPVVASDLDPAVITGQTALAVAPADTDEFLISDAGTLKRIDASLVGGGGITMADQFRLAADLTGTNAVITANLERVDDASFAKIGTGMSVSSGVFSFPSTGLYKITAKMAAIFDGPDNGYLNTEVTQNNSSYDLVGQTAGSTDNTYQNDSSGAIFFNVTNISNDKVRFVTASFNTNSGLIGNTGQNTTYFEFIRLGDSQ